MYDASALRRLQPPAQLIELTREVVQERIRGSDEPVPECPPHCAKVGDQGLAVVFAGSTATGEH